MYGWSIVLKAEGISAGFGLSESLESFDWVERMELSPKPFCVLVSY